MADPITAAVVISFLSPFMFKAGEKLAERAGDALAEKVGQIYSTVKDGLAGDEYAGMTLLRLSEAPDDAGRKAALESVLQERLDEDDDFRGRLSILVNEAKQLDTEDAITFGIRNVAIRGDAISSNINTGDINVTRKN